MSSVRSFAEQGARYFRRPHECIPGEAVKHPAAWLGADLRRNTTSWVYSLSESDISELNAAAGDAISNGRDLTAIDRSNFHLPNLAPRIRRWRDNIMQGKGVMLVRGLPVTEWSTEQTEIAYWGIGQHLGVPGAQNPEHELLGHVTDYGESADNQFVRLYRTTSNIRYHCDGADIVGLLCLKPAKSGGQSRIVSTVTLFNRLLEASPRLAARLFEPFRLDKRGETRDGELPYSLLPPCCFAAGELRTFYHSDYYRSVERHDGVTLEPEERAILDFYDEQALDPDTYLDMWLEPGDMQFISNHTIAHARTAYEDHEEPARKRHLLRLWLSAG